MTAAVVAAVIVVFGLIWWKSSGSPGPSDLSSGTQANPADGPQAALYFPAVSGMLELEMRTAPPDLDPAASKQWLAEQLVAGPESQGLQPVLPTDTQVASVFAAPDGTVFIDLTIPESPRIGMGSTEEMLTLYSIVNTMVLGDESAQAAVLLINGRQRETLAGHLDTSRPLYPRPDLIREPG